MESSTRDPESAHRRGALDRKHFDLGDVRRKKTGADRRDQAIQGVGLSGREHLDGAVGPITHLTVEVELADPAEDMVAETNPLNLSAGDQPDLPRIHASAFR